MNTFETDSTGKLRIDERLIVSAGILITCAMMTCVAASFVQMGELAASGWRGSYLILVSFLVAMEAIYSQRLLYHFYFTDPKLVIYRLTEWVVIILVLKISQLLNRGVENLIVELAGWQKDFVSDFFTDETIFGLVVLIIVWYFSGRFAHELIPLEADQRVLRLETESGLYEDRSAVRQRLSNLILLVGGGLVMITALLRSNTVSNWFDLPMMRASVGYTILYFYLGFVLLSLTQFNLLRIRWFRESCPVRTDIAGRWLLYSLLFLFILTVIASLLPTQYSINLLAILQYLFFVIVSILNLIITLLMLPILWVIGFLASLFGSQTEIDQSPMLPSVNDLMAPVASEPIPWWELVKSIFFWVVLLGVVGFSVTYYFKENRELWHRVKAMPIISAFLNLLDRLWDWLDGVNKQIGGVIDAGWSRLRSRGINLQRISPWRYRNPYRMLPRDRVRFYYLAMVRRGGEIGHQRNPSQTPLEYSRNLVEALGSGELKASDVWMGTSADGRSEDDQPFLMDVDIMTDTFMHARYSRKEVTESDAQLVKNAWQHVRSALRRIRSKKE